MSAFPSAVESYQLDTSGLRRPIAEPINTPVITPAAIS
jgi:hypothetical protein